MILFCIYLVDLRSKYALKMRYDDDFVVLDALSDAWVLYPVPYTYSYNWLDEQSADVAPDMFVRLFALLNPPLCLLSCSQI